MCEVLEVLGQPTTGIEPSKHPLHNPAPWYHLEPLRLIRSLHNLDLQGREGLGRRALKLRSVVSAIGEQAAQEREQAEHRGELQSAAVAVLDVGGMDDDVEQETYRVDQDMPLLALDLLARIVARRVDRGPPFSALLMLWLSITHAVGLASRPIFSRHLT